MENNDKPANPMTTNQIIITNIDPDSENCGKRYDESTLGELLRDEGMSENLLKDICFLRFNGIDSRFGSRGWQVYYCGSFVFPLNPRTYKISFADQIERSKVREMIEEIEGTVRGMQSGYEDRKLSIEHIQSIASRYLDTE